MGTLSPQAGVDAALCDGTWSFQIGPTWMTYEGQFIVLDNSTSGSGSEDDNQSEKRLKHGQGVMKWEDGREYRGQFQFDKMHGFGTMTWPSGARYVGQYCENRKGGIGKLSLPDGSSFEGNWYKGKRHGEILYVNAEGQAFRMEYETDQVVKTESLPSFDGWTLKPGYDSFRIDSVASECKDTSCCICLLDFAVGDVCARTQCGHFFHKECIDNWALRKNQCPLCQRTIPLQKVYEI
jgi:hypothetical protein